jgi:hypothetical protein
VKLGGVVYELPGDLPMEIFLKLNKASEIEEEGDELKALEEMVNTLTDLFVWKQRGTASETEIRENVSKILGNRGVKFVTQLLKNIYDDEPEVEVVEDAEGKSETPGTTTTNT